MTDIVDRLRDWAGPQEIRDNAKDAYPTMKQAAAEIEKLREKIIDQNLDIIELRGIARTVLQCGQAFEQKLTKGKGENVS